MRRIAALVICAATIAPSAVASAPASPLLRRASSLTGLKVRHAVRVVPVSQSRFDTAAARSLDRTYPRSLQRIDDALYTGLGLLPAEKSIRSTLVSSIRAARAWYDPVARIVRTRIRSRPGRRELLGELARALVDQNFNLRRLNGLRARDRDAALAAQAVIDGMTALASGLHSRQPHGSALERFLGLERNAGLDFGRRLLVQLRYLGGHFALATALRPFPRTTAEVLHIDKFLQRDRAASVSLASTIGQARLTASQTFGELDLLALLRAYDIADADSIASGWSGGRIALYTAPDGTTAVALVLKWESTDEADQWRDAAARYVAAAFPDATARRCPEVDACWLTGTRELASAGVGNTTVFASGVNGELIAATLAGS